MNRFLVFLISLLLLTPRISLAWGEQGHRITGLVAQELLTPEAKKGVAALMGSSSLGDFSLYLDKNKLVLDKKIPGSRQWHYDDRPVCQPDAPKRDWCPDGKCASVQIVRHYRALIDQHSSKDEKQFAIYTLVHLIGDIHQPLHSSDHDDRGGNDIRVVLQLPVGKRTTNLHSAWDTEFVKAAFTETDERKIAKALASNASASDIAKFQQGSPAKWLAESFLLATITAYGKLPGFETACGDDKFGKEKMELSPSYTDAAIGAIPELLLKAGARIAGMLNRAFPN
jgi:S1/P1 Nuclease